MCFDDGVVSVGNGQWDGGFCFVGKPNDGYTISHDTTVHIMERSDNSYLVQLKFAM